MQPLQPLALRAAGERRRRLLVVLGEPQADGDDAAVGDLAAPPARWRRAARCRPARGVRRSSLGEEVGEREPRASLAAHRQPVDLGQRAERDVAGHEEVAEQARVGRGRRRHVDEEAVERLRLFRRRQQIDVVALAHRRAFGRRQDALVAHHQRRLRPGRHERRAADRGCWRRPDSRRFPARAGPAGRARPGAAADRCAATRRAAGCAAGAMVQPCTSSDISTTTKAMSK